jgi:hypothetical protein
VDPEYVFAVRGMDKTCKPVLVSPAVKRAGLLDLIAMLLRCHIGMDSLTGLNV